MLASKQVSASTRAQTAPVGAAGSRGSVRALKAIAAIWWRVASGFREWFRGAEGDQAYENYLRFASKQPGRPMTREEFYLDRLQHKYSRPSRCC
jgi:uncharacterized short protein YbdD (DUF466 family)